MCTEISEFGDTEKPFNFHLAFNVMLIKDPEN